MISEADVKTAIYKLVSTSALAGMISGVVSKTVRPANSVKEDIVISVLDSGNGQLQDFIVNVNIYIPYSKSSGDVLDENTVRIRTVCAEAIKLLERHNGGTYRLELSKQRIMPVDGKTESLINNRVLFTQCNVK